MEIQFGPQEICGSVQPEYPCRLALLCVSGLPSMIDTGCDAGQGQLELLKRVWKVLDELPIWQASGCKRSESPTSGRNRIFANDFNTPAPQARFREGGTAPFSKS